MGKPAKKISPDREQTPAPAFVPATPGVPTIGPEGKPSLARALTPKILLDSTPAEWLFNLKIEQRHLLLLSVLCIGIFFPYLGAVGFWDPWEPHYGEVARSMLVREDYVHPYWESAYFFSKPILPLWLMALGMKIAGTNDPLRGTSVSTEWWVRSIFALVALGGALMTYLGAARTMGRRVGIWSAVVLVTTPFYFLLARQAMVDMPFVAINTAAIACLMIAVFEKEYVQDGWLYGFYALAGLGCLAKGLLGIALPGAAMLGYLMLSGDWRLLARLRLVTGPIVTALVFMPWYTVMTLFPGKDDESNTWFQRFIIHDHFNRMGSGVHTTTPNTTFVYFIEQLGFGMFPWVAAIPGALANLFAPPPITDTQTRQRKARLFVISWAVTTFTFFSFSQTKFHHYGFPAVPALAMLIALWIERVLDEGVTGHALAWVMGGILFAMVAQNLTMQPKHLVDLYVYNYERPYPSREVDPYKVFVALFAVAPVIALFGAPAVRSWVASLFGGKATKVKEDDSDRLFVVGAVALLAVAFSVYVSAYHWRKLTPHWTQRDLFWTYLQESKPSEPIGAYQMNWRGETFYSRNLVRQLKEPNELRDFVAVPGREWLLVEHSRLAAMKSTIPAQYKVRVVEKNFSDKFALVVVE